MESVRTLSQVEEIKLGSKLLSYVYWSDGEIEKTVHCEGKVVAYKAVEGRNIFDES